MSFDKSRPVVVINTGNLNATNVIFTVYLPNGFVLVVVPVGAVYDPINRTLTWDIGNVSPDEVQKFEFMGYFTDVGGKAFVDVLSGDNGSVDCSANISVGSPDVRINLSFDKPRSVVNETITGTVNVSNAGDDDAVNMIVVVKLPDGFVLVDVPVGAVYDPIDRTLNWVIDVLKPNESKIFTFKGYFNDKGDYTFIVDVFGDNFGNVSHIALVEVGSGPNSVPPKPKSVDAVAVVMKSTGVPFVALILVMISLVFVGFRRQKEDN